MLPELEQHPVADGVHSDARVLLQRAHQSVAKRFGDRDPLPQTAMHLINCAAEVVSMLPAGDLDTARQALAEARAAVTTASYAVCRVHDETRIRPS